MTTTRKTKRFTSGGSQAVRLPAEFRFAGESVYVRRDPVTGNVILSANEPGSYAAFMALRDALEPVPADFLDDAERRPFSESRDPLDGFPS